MENKYSNIKVNTALSLIVHGSNDIGFALAKTLLEQGGRVIIVDKFDGDTKKIVTELKKLGQADFIDFHGLESLYKSINRIDYIFYLLNTKDEERNLTSKDFLEESNYLNQTLKTALKNNTKTSLVTSLKLNKRLTESLSSLNVAAPSPYSTIELQKYCETLTAEYRDKSKLNVRILRLGAILGENATTISDQVVDDLFKESVKKGTLTIKGEGLDTHHLINIDDVIYGILKLTFSDQTEGEVITLANNHEYTTLSIAYKLLEINGDIREIKFKDSDNDSHFSISTYTPATNAEKFGWQQNSTLEQSIIQTFKAMNPQLNFEKKKVEFKNDEGEVASVIVQSPDIRTPIGKVLDSIFLPIKNFFNSLENSYKAAGQKLTPSNTIRYGIITVITVLLLYFLIIPVINTSLGFYLAYTNLKDSYTNLTQLNTTASRDHLTASYTYITKASDSFSRLKWVFTLTKQENFYDNFSQLLFGSTYAISGARDIVEATEPLQRYIQNFEPALDTQNNIPATTRQYTDLLAKLQQNKNQLDKGGYNLDLASSLINGIDIAAFPQFLQSALVELKTANTNVTQQIQPIEKFVTFLPEILGLKERMTYLVLLQNPQEIRSTGGWISSYAIIGFEGGQIRQFKVDDIYNLDGSLINKGIKVVPPSSMRNGLGVNNMTFSLMNWNPDLQTVKSSAEYMLSQVEPGQKINGVITIDTEFFKQLLNVWGQVNIPGENEAITAANLDNKIVELHKEFTPGQSVKSNFLANLTDTIIKKVLNSKIAEYTKIGNAVFESLNQKHIMVYLDNKEAFAYFSENNWAGNLKSENQSQPFSIQWNWGANKANRFLDQTQSMNVDVISPSQIQYTYSLATQNKSTAKVYPQGDYIDYLRVYLPAEAAIDSVKGFEDSKYTVYLENGFKIVGGFSNVNVLSSKTVEVKYTLKPTANSLFQPITTSQNQSTMKLNLFKQAGLGSIPLKLTITYPDSWSALIHTDLERFGNQITTQTKLDSDKEFTIIWENK